MVDACDSCATLAFCALVVLDSTSVLVYGMLSVALHHTRVSFFPTCYAAPAVAPVAP